MQHLYLLRKQNSYDLSKEILETVYIGLVESVLTFDMCTLYGHLQAKNMSRLSKVVNTTSKIIGNGQK